MNTNKNTRNDSNKVIQQKIVHVPLPPPITRGRNKRNKRNKLRTEKHKKHKKY